jgi:hypothetical protein
MNLGIVVRGVGERTTDACVRLLSQEFPNLPIVVTNQTPLSEGVKAGFMAALELGRDWSLIVDADTLTTPGSTERLLKHADKRTFWIQGNTKCKFLGTRQGGNYLYQTHLLEKVIPLIERNMIRPENVVADIMTKGGYKSRYVPEVITCLHDYEQYYRDIYRKFIVHGIKFRKRMESFKRRERKNKDKDFYVALRALEIQQDPKKFIVDASRDYSPEIKRLGLAEKGPLRVEEALRLVNS